MGRGFESHGAYSFLKQSSSFCFEYTSFVIYPLLTERLSIEPLALSDLEPFVKYRQDPAIARYQSWDESYSLDQGRELIQSQAGVLMPEMGEWLQLGLYDRNSGLLIGDVAIQALEDQKDCFELGFTLAKEFQGLGYANEAVSKVLEHLVAEEGAKKFIATPDSRNEASIRLLVSLGFQQNQSKTWNEEFKGETVTVYYFEKI